MLAMTLDVEQWAEEQFTDCDLGDRRRNERLIQFARQVAAHPSGSTPDQTRSWAACKGAYRLMDCADVSFAGIIEPHCRQTRARRSVSSRSLIIHDTTEVSFSTTCEPIDGLGPTGNGVRQGFHLHTALKVCGDSAEIHGLAGQLLFYRRPKLRRADGKRETAAQAKRRPRESEIWKQLIAQVGAPPEGEEFVHLYDRGADNYEVFGQAHLLGTGWIIRASQLQRKIRPVAREAPDQPPALPTLKLQELLAAQPFWTGYAVAVPATKTSRARTAQVNLRWVALWMPRPAPCSGWAQEHCPAFLRMTAVEVCETDPPAGATALRWVLLTHADVSTVDEARQVADDYSRRPMIEDYHKCLKTGCRIEERQYATAARLERIAAVLSVTAIRLLQIRSVARVDPNRPARDVAPQEWLETLRDHVAAHSPAAAANDWTIQEFLRRLAMLGGFLARQHDGQPGGITLWRGITKLILLIEGRRLARRKCG